MKTSRSTTRNIILMLSLFAGAMSLRAQGTAFTYQGRLNDGTNPATGKYDLQFYLRDALVAGNPVGATNTLTALGVTNGLLTATLDFGAGIFTGANRWLAISVRTNGVGAFIPLTPRQKLTPTPYAITASNLTGTLPTAQLSGTLPSAQLGGLYSAALTLNNPANSFTGNGAGLTGVNAGTLGGLGASSFWKLLGNASTTPGVNFLGTTDNQPLELKVNGQRAFRLEPTTNSPNVIGGFSGNSADAGVVGATISGGGASGAPNLISISSDQFLSQFHTIGGGLGNEISDYSGATISGGVSNSIHFGRNGTIAGGIGNRLGTPAVSCSIGGGSFNSANRAFSTTIAGGDFNEAIECTAGSIGGGIGNRIHTTSFGTIGGGSSNWIQTFSDYATIGGGRQNASLGTDSTISGGVNNRAGVGGAATIGGGDGNEVGARYGTISGGAMNAIEYGNIGGTVGGGQSNVVKGDYGTIAGGNGNSLGYIDGLVNDAPYSAIGGGSGNLVFGSSYVTIAGGFANQIRNAAGFTSSYAAIGGGFGNEIIGGDYGTISGGQSNNISPSGLLGTIGGGLSNTNSGIAGTIGGGKENLIAGNNSSSDYYNRYSTIGGGLGNLIEGQIEGASISGGGMNKILFQSTYGTVGGGQSNVVGTTYGTIPGGLQASAQNYGQMAHASGQFATTGDAQTSVLVCRGTTANATQTDLFLDGVSERMIMPTNSTWGFDILVTGRAANGNSAVYQLLGAAQNNAGISVFVATPQKNVIAENLAAWDVNMFAPATNGSIVIRVTGQAATSIRWVASVRTTEVSY